MKHIVKRNKKIIGFVYKKCDNTFWYAFGKPSHNIWIEFECNSIEQGIARIQMHTNS